MADIKSLDSIVAKWIRVTPQRTQDYEAGVRNPTADWAGNTANAENAWQQGVTQAAGRRAFSRGAQAKGTAGWQQATIAKGVGRWGPGVQQAEAEFRGGFSPYHAVIQRTTLPPKGPAGDAANYQRVQAIGQALHDAKVRGT
jgi:hypothetical protein